ncbi:MAG: hypothetical protein HYU84_12865 [Chloroflexi bacterium]|nr:hypothetical protein [Chloroflexota bacterium]MBI3160640.1 hypothetical protein [Chloroflexota bacterium]
MRIAEDLEVALADFEQWDVGGTHLDLATNMDVMKSIMGISGSGFCEEPGE